MYFKELVIQSFTKSHNHDVSKELYLLYPQNRDFSETEMAQIKELLKLKTPVNEVARHVEETMNKSIPNKVRNKTCI